MSDRVHIAHLYVIPGNGRLNIFGSAAALRSLAAALKSLPERGPQEFALTVAEIPQHGGSLPHLRCAKDDEPLLCVVDGDRVCITGNWDAREHLAIALENQANEWHAGGHQHVYPAERYRDDTPGYLVLPESEEILIGGHGYLPDEMFGLSSGS